MKRVLSGSLAHLSPPALLRLIAASRASGSLDLVTDVGELRLEVRDGRTAPIDPDDASGAADVLECISGAYRFEPVAAAPEAGDDWLALDELSNSVRPRIPARRNPLASDVDVDRLIAGEVGEVVAATSAPTIHVLPVEAAENPLEDLLEGLQEASPDEILLLSVGVIATDPRMWRGALDHEWRRRGWQVELLDPTGEDRWPDGLDAAVIHHQLSITRVGHEQDWTGLVRRLDDRGVPVIWVGPLGDPVWVHQLVESGVRFLLPPPSGEAGEAVQRFRDTLTAVVQRQLTLGQALASSGEPGSPLSELIEALVHQGTPGESAALLLQLAAGHLTRGALFTIEETAIRCRAAFGYSVPAGGGTLPRGIGFLERLIRSAESVNGLDPFSAGGSSLARSLGEEELPSETVVIPVGMRRGVVGVLVGDRVGDPLGDLSELEQIARRVGGAFV
jgi:hypothetical protein